MENINTPKYWNSRFKNGETGWDLGKVSLPIKEYIDQIEDKSSKILIPGAGNAYEAQYFYNKGFFNVYIADWAKIACENFAKRNPSFPKKHILNQDFFKLKGSYNLIIEQTFFCALDPSLRKNYVEKMVELLKPKGKLVGLLFNIPLNKNQPPFGGSKEEYFSLFESNFNVITMEVAYNSIDPRKNNELFFIMQKK